MNSDTDITLPAKTSKRPHILFGCLVVLTFAASYLLPKDPLIAARINDLVGRGIASAPSSSEVQNMERLDPALGTDLPVTEVGRQVRKQAQKSAKGYLLVSLGDCMGCISFDFKLWQQQAARRGVSLIGISGGTEQHIADYRRAMQITIPIVRDPQNTLARQINMYWSGRVYYFDDQWKLRWLMRGLGNPHSLDKLEDLNALIEGGTR